MDDERPEQRPEEVPGHGGAEAYDDAVPPGAPGPHGHRPLAVPGDGQRMGLDRRTEEGALIDFAGSLDPARRGHRVVAWVLIGAFGLPALLALWQLLGILLDGLLDALLPG